MVGCGLPPAATWKTLDNTDREGRGVAGAECRDFTDEQREGLGEGAEGIPGGYREFVGTERRLPPGGRRASRSRPGWRAKLTPFGKVPDSEIESAG